MNTTLRVLSLVAIILVVFWSTYALANGFRAVDGDPSYFIPQAAQFLFWGVAGWAVFGSLSKILGRLEALEQGVAAED
jgi:hypothetical protein